MFPPSSASESAQRQDTNSHRSWLPLCGRFLPRIATFRFTPIYQVSEGGKDVPENLLALCPTCHAYYHAGHISREAIFAYKSTLAVINRAFDLEAIDRLMFLEPLKKDFLIVSGDGVLFFDRLIAAGLASFTPKSNNNGLLVTYAVNLSPKGKMLIEAWKSGDHLKIKEAVTSTIPQPIFRKKAPK